MKRKDSNGILCIKSPWPSMARTIYGDHKRFVETYLKPFPGFYFTGDGALTNKDGHFQITGRVDDVINVRWFKIENKTDFYCSAKNWHFFYFSVHRIGTAEIEDILVSVDCKYFSVNQYCHKRLLSPSYYFERYLWIKENSKTFNF